mgnify:CR=1 FL=1
MQNRILFKFFSACFLISISNSYVLVLYNLHQQQKREKSKLQQETIQKRERKRDTSRLALSLFSSIRRRRKFQFSAEHIHNTYTITR